MPDVKEPEESPAEDGPAPPADEPTAGGGESDFVAERLMLKSLWEIGAEMFDQPHANDGVQIAYERMMISVYDRMARICRSDLPADEP